MMRIIAILLASLMCLGVFAACGSSENEDNSSKAGDANANDSGNGDSQSTDSEEEKETAYTTFDAGEVTVDVPDGWLAFQNIDIHADDPGTLSKRSVTVCKGATSEMDMFTKPYVKIDYQGENIYLAPPMRDFYDKVVDLEPIELGGHNWEGFSCDSMGYPIVMLYVDEGDDQFLVTISCGLDDDAISLDDEEVIRIIESFTVKNLGESSEASDGSADESADE